MRTDAVLGIDAMNLLIKGLGELETERFIYLIKSEHFDYTEWQHTLWQDKSIDEIHAAAMAYSKERRQKTPIIR